MVRGFLSFLIQFLFPQRCLICGGPAETGCKGVVLPEGWPKETIEFLEGAFRGLTDDSFLGSIDVICKDCLFTLEHTRGSVSVIESGIVPTGRVRVISPFFINDSLLSIVHSFKFKGVKTASAMLSWWMALCLSNCIAQFSIAKEALTLVPVPLHPSRMRERGYNQSDVVARAIGKRLGVEVDSKALVRKRKTKRQSNLSGDLRVENVWGAFELASKKHIAGKIVVLVDDLVTTGSTASACIDVLYQGKPRDVIVLCAGRSRRELKLVGVD